MEHARHVFRVLLVVAAALGTIAVGRALVVPRSYGVHGPYRADNVGEQASVRAPLHGGAASCAACHEGRAAALAKGAHRSVSCEVCHAPLGRHVRDGAVIAPMRIERSHALCARCHRKIDGRPAAFPQVVLEQHVPGGARGAACLECHDPHSPKP
jgi:hypothetical protein